MDEKFSVGNLIILIAQALIVLGLLSNYPLTSFLILSFLFFIIYPIIDKLSGKIKPYAYEIICAQKNEAYDSAINPNLIPLYISILLQLAAIFLGIYNVSKEGAQWFPYFLLVSYSSMLAFTTSHELYHTKKKFQTFMGRISMIVSFWSHDEIHHLYVHHRDETACLPNDGVLSHLNQSVYGYALQMIIVTFRESWKIQKELLKKNNKKVISIHNYMLVGLLITLALTIAIFGIFGWLSGLFYLCQCAIGIFAFAMTTYTQHYGLVRRKKPDGTYEDFTYMNIWSCPSKFGNKNTFDLFRHAHHHMFIFCPYNQLKIIEHSPMIPMDVHKMNLVTLVPPLWFKIMNKEVEKVLKRRDELEAKGML